MKGLYTEKIKTFIKQVRKGMSTFDAYFTKGVELYNKKKYELALEFFTTALSQNNAQNFANYNLALTYQQLNKDNEALEYYMKFLSDYPKDYSGLFNTAQIYYNQNDYENASKYFFKCFEVKPCEESVRKLTKAYIQDENIDDIFTLVEYIFNSENDKRLAYVIAQVFESKKYLMSDMTFIQNAINIYLRLLNLEPENYEYLYAASVAYSKMGDWTKAIEYAQKALSINPKSCDANSQLGLVYYCLDDIENCIQYYEKAFKYNKKNDYKIYTNLAYAYEKAGRTIDAIELFKQTIIKFAEFPSKEEIKNHLRQIIKNNN